MTKRGLRTVGWCAMLVVAAVLLDLSLRGIDWKTVASTIMGIRPGYAALAMAIGTLALFVRATRWRILLQAEAPVPFWITFWAVVAGYFGNNFLPARGGELVRSHIVQTQSALTVTYVLATAISERAADAAALVVIGAATMLCVPQPPSWMDAARVPFALLGLAGVLGLSCLPLLERRLHGMLDRAPCLQIVVRQVLLGVRSFHHWQRVAQFSALTVIIWTLDAIATATLAHAMAVPMTLAVAMLLIVALSLSSAIPSTPGYVGVYQFIAVTVLKPFGVSASAAIAFILVTQACNYLLTSILGLVAINRYARVKEFSWPAFLRRVRPIHIQN